MGSDSPQDLKSYRIQTRRKVLGMPPSWLMALLGCNLQPGIKWLGNTCLLSWYLENRDRRAQQRQKLKATLGYTTSLNQPGLHEIPCLSVCLCVCLQQTLNVVWLTIKALHWRIEDSCQVKQVRQTDCCEYSLKPGPYALHGSELWQQKGRLWVGFSSKSPQSLTALPIFARSCPSWRVKFEGRISMAWASRHVWIWLMWSPKETSRLT